MGFVKAFWADFPHELFKRGDYQVAAAAEPHDDEAYCQQQERRLLWENRTRWCLIQNLPYSMIDSRRARYLPTRALFALWQDGRYTGVNVSIMPYGLP